MISTTARSTSMKSPSGSAAVCYWIDNEPLRVSWDNHSIPWGWIGLEITVASLVVVGIVALVVMLYKKRFGNCFAQQGGEYDAMP